MPVCQNGIKRVIVTSSTAAVTAQHPKSKEIWHDETYWNRDSNLAEGPYRYSKRLAEEAAWDLAHEHNLELVVINPSFILGPPVLDRVEGESLTLMAKFLKGDFEAGGSPSSCAGICDVRDVVCTQHGKLGNTC